QVEQLYPPIFGIPNLARLKDYPYPVPSWYDSYHEEAVANFYKVMSPALATTASASSPITWVDRLYAHLRYLLSVGSGNSRGRIKNLICSRSVKALAKTLYYIVSYVLRRFPVFANVASSMLT